MQNPFQSSVIEDGAIIPFLPNHLLVPDIDLSDDEAQSEDDEDQSPKVVATTVARAIGLKNNAIGNVDEDDEPPPLAESSDDELDVGPK